MSVSIKKKSKISPVKISNDLDKLNGKNFFPEKLQEANETLKKNRLPKLK